MTKQKMRFRFEEFHVEAPERDYTSRPNGGLAVSHDEDGDLQIDTDGRTFFLSPDQWLEICERVQIEPIPEPKTAGQVLHGATCFAQVDYHDDWADLTPGMRQRWEAQAARLGIKGEG